MIEVRKFPLYARVIREDSRLSAQVPESLLGKLGSVNSMKGGHIPFYVNEIEFLEEVDALVESGWLG